MRSLHPGPHVNLKAINMTDSDAGFIYGVGLVVCLRFRVHSLEATKSRGLRIAVWCPESDKLGSYLKAGTCTMQIGR